MSAMQRFLAWEERSRDSINVKRCYCEAAGELPAGVMLSQIIYWFLRGRDGKQRTRIEIDGEPYIAKASTDWMEECFLTPDQSRRCLEVLEKRGLIKKLVRKFAGTPMTHIAVCWDVLVPQITTATTPSPLGQEPKSEVGGNPSPLGQNPKSSTETKAETTSEKKKGVGAKDLLGETEEQLPTWIPRAAWDGYIEMRKKIKKPPTQRAIELVVMELDKQRLLGHDVAAMLDRSTRNNWVDVYAPKSDAAAPPPSAPPPSRPNGFDKGDLASYGL